MKKLAMIMAVVGMILAVSGTAEADWSDNFNDNTAQQTWTVGGSGTATVQNNRYELGATYNVTDQAVIPYVGTESATDCVLRGKVQEITSGDNFLAYLAARLDPTYGSGYVCGVSSDGHLWLGKLVSGSYQSLASLATQPSFDTTDCQLKFSLIGTALKGKVWSTVNTEPTDWQIEATDSDYTSGYGGVMAATYHTLGWDTVNVAFDDVSMVPEPGTMCLLALGGLALIRRRRRQA